MSGDEDDVHMFLRPSTPRFLLGVAVLLALGVCLLYIAVFTAPILGLRLFLGALGVGSLIVTVRMWAARNLELELTRDVLREAGGGRELARVVSVVKVDRGPFAFKPPNGFLLRLEEKGSRVWVPGLWWRLGRWVGVGGVVNAGQSRAMAELISDFAEAARKERDET
ncbi:MAG: hypothetical protein AAGF74_06390 [Pseudomonadota bacterium]